ncbi:MAG: ribosomal protein [Rickettsiaceae bacterium]|jgi:small subunit ribosomal protein S7|nr:ribosomal protein [Rickettsiaceae bacterium]
MSRRHRAEKRIVLPDAKYDNKIVAKFMNCLMMQGKKSVAEGAVYGAFDEIEKKLKLNPLEVFLEAIENVKPAVEVRSRRVGGATYQVPVEVRSDRRWALSIKWIIEASRKRKEKTIMTKLAGELIDAYKKQGEAMKKRENTHKMADANKAFAHYRW